MRMRITTKDPIIDGDTVKLEFTTFNHSPYYSFSPDELYCSFVKYDCTKIEISGLFFEQNIGDLNRFLYLCKHGLPLLDKQPVYNVSVESELSLKELKHSSREKRLLQYIDNIIYNNKTISVNE